METDPTRTLEWMIGLPVITFLGGEDGAAGEARIHVETRASRLGCPDCGVVARVKDRSRVELVDLPLFGRPTRLVWHKRRWTCPDADCPVGRGPRRTTGSPLLDRCSPPGPPGGPPPRSAVTPGA